jgi:hypothetical protein
LRKLKTVNRIAAVAMLLLVNPVCGNAQAAGTPAGRAAGIYAGTTRYYRFPGPVASRPEQLFGAVGLDGTGYFISVPGPGSDIRVFQNLKAIGAVMSPEREVPIAGRGVARGAQGWPLEIRHTGTSAGAFDIQGKFNCGDCYIALNLRMQRLTHRSMSLSYRAGTYRGFDVNRLTKATVTLDKAGHFAGTDVLGCRLSGTLNRVGSLNLFEVNLDFIGPSACHGAMRGIAFFDTRDRTGRFDGAAQPYLYLMGANSDFSHGFAMVLAYQRQ